MVQLRTYLSRFFRFHYTSVLVFGVSPNIYFIGALGVLTGVPDKLLNKSARQNAPPPPLDANSHFSLELGCQKYRMPLALTVLLKVSVLKFSKFVEIELFSFSESHHFYLIICPVV